MWFDPVGPGGETSKIKEVFAPYCIGHGVDLGCGRDPINDRAIRIDTTPHHSNLNGDARNLYWFKTGVLDYVYASHLLEDFAFETWTQVLSEWLRVLKKGGYLCIAVPHHVRFRENVRLGINTENMAHKHESTGPGELTSVLAGKVEVVFDKFFDESNIREYNVLFCGKKKLNII